MPATAPYGSWRSPISAAQVAGQSVSFGGLVAENGKLYWSESRPQEGGRVTLLRLDDHGPSELLPAPYNARTRVHEYGGGAFTVADGSIYFSNHVDNRVYRLDLGTAPVPVTGDGDRRYADLLFDGARRRLIAVCEEPRPRSEPRNTLVAMAAQGAGEPQVLASGHDFYASPALRRDGRQIAWLAWNHPSMPWDGSELWLAEFDDSGRTVNPRRVAGGARESIFQPRFAPDGSLYFVSDRSGWWNLYRFRDGRVEPLWPRAAEFGLPQWVFGMSTYALVGEDRLVAAYREAGRWQLANLDTRTLAVTPLAVPDTDIGGMQAMGDGIVYVGASPGEPAAIVRLHLASGQREVLRSSVAGAPDPGYVSVAESVEFPTGNGDTAYGYFYPPANRDYALPRGERPPLLVLSHGGPSAAATTAWNPRLQFWTSRGFAVLDVDYRGSTGHGRAYREKLNGRWGEADVEDCVAGAHYLASRGLVDANRMVIRGGSAGGFTTLCALTFHRVFRAGACYYGVSDLETLARDTHKFEAHYLDRLIAPYPSAREVYRARSPIHHVDRLNCPVIFFQGLDDKVVPPNQTERMVEALRRNKLPVAYVPFEGEGHGFRRAGSIARALEAELYFYSRVFGFRPAEDLAPVRIDNEPA